MTKTYSELITIPTFEERFAYLKLDGVVGCQTFGYDRYLNQLLYRSREWRRFRRDILVRDGGCDLAIDDREILIRPTIHHITSITLEDIENRHPRIFDPENVITTSDDTHRAIHYGDERLLIITPKERQKGDTTLWTAYSHR